MAAFTLYPERLRNERLLQGKKRVVDHSPGFCDRSGLIAVGSKAEGDLTTIIKLLGGGSPIPDRFYRNYVDDGQDRLLNDFGIKHLHLGGSTSDILLFLVEYVDRVLLLEVNDHNAFAESPVGSTLQRLHMNALAKSDTDAMAARAAQAADNTPQARADATSKLKLGLKPKRPSGPKGVE